MDEQEIKRLVEKYWKTKGARRLYEHRLSIIKTDPNAPICIICEFCEQTGFLFHCTIYELPEEDEKSVGEFGNVYYWRKGRKPKTYPNTPQKSIECESFQPLPLAESPES